MNDSLVYRDIFVSVFVDSEKCLVIYVNDKGNTRVVNYDDNFYSVEEDIVAYDEMLRDSLKDDTTNDIREVDREDYLRLLGNYIKSVEKELETSDCEGLNWEYLESRGIRKYE